MLLTETVDESSKHLNGKKQCTYIE